MRILFRRFFSRWQNLIGVLLVMVYVFAAVFAPYLSPEDPKHPGPFLQVGKRTETDPLPPSEKAILGMLPRGVDVYHALIWGSRDALKFGLIVVLSSSIFGILYGAMAGIAGSRVSSLMLRVSDSFLAFPPIAGFVLLQQLFATTVTSMGGMYFKSEFFGQVIEIHGPMTTIQFLFEHLNFLMLSMIIFSWMPYARLVNSMVITLKQTDFVQAARALGASPFWIIRKHLIQNATGPAMVLAARDVGGVVLLQATLTFINLGGDSVWGAMLAQGRNWVIGPGGSLFGHWWVFLPATLAIMIFGIAWNIVGDGLNDVFGSTSHHEFYKPPFWDRLFKKTKKPESSVEAPPLFATETLPPPTHSVPALYQQSTPDRKSDPLHASRSVLITARDHVSQGRLAESLHAYQHLIQHGKMISDILPDLAVLVKYHPQDPQVWQTLGDALCRSGDAAHAAQAYDQARKLTG
jgi:peptide/nickel transport system permease protein